MSSRITVTYRSCSYIHTCDHTYTLSCIKDECVCVCILHYRTVCMYLVLIHPAVCVCMFIWMFSDPCKLPVTLGIAQHCSINIHCTLINLVSSVVRTHSIQSYQIHTNRTYYRCTHPHRYRDTYVLSGMLNRKH